MIVLDADVVIGALDASDAHHTTVRRLFLEWRKRGESVSISVVNLSEVLVAPAADPRSLRQARTAISALGIGLQPPTEATAVDAARLRRVHPISLADGYCLATARQARAEIASFDEKVIRAATAERIPVVAA